MSRPAKGDTASIVRGVILRQSHIVAALGLLLSVSLGAPVGAQSTSNSLVPGVTPYAPKAPPAAAAPQPLVHRNATPGETGAETPASYDYRLGAGDKLKITVFGEDGLTGEFFVAGNGRISFPLIGEVPAAGMTVQAVQDEIRSALKDGYIKDPRVSAEVLIFRPYYILGEVTKPGEYPYSNGISVMNAVATAGGFTYRANQKYIYVKKADEEKEHKVRLTDGILLDPGETIRIAERYF